LLVIDVYPFCTADDRPFPKDLQNHVVPGAAIKWKYIGTQLFDPTSGDMLDIIEKECQNDIKRCCICMLDKWLDKTPDASWNQVLAALRTPSVELNYLADQIEQKLLKEKCETITSMLV